MDNKGNRIASRWTQGLYTKSSNEVCRIAESLFLYVCWFFDNVPRTIVRKHMFWWACVKRERKKENESGRRKTNGRAGRQWVWHHLDEEHAPLQRTDSHEYRCNRYCNPARCSENVKPRNDIKARGRTMGLTSRNSGNPFGKQWKSF